MQINLKTNRMLYECNGEVLAFTNNKGLKTNGADVGGCNQPGYQQDNNGTPFSLAGAMYTGTLCNKGQTKCGNKYLNYDGHPGYDYHAGRGTPVFAAVTGMISYPWNAVGMTRHNYDAYCWFHALALHPDNNENYVIYYLHLDTHPAIIYLT
jgi:hypothetical protein